MSPRLFSLNADLRRLREEGYSVQIRGGLLVMREVPYVDEQRKVRKGTLVSSLTLAGDATQTPDNHVVHFDGDYPCEADGSRLQRISHQTQPFDLGQGVTARHSFSSKPAGGYADYHHKMTTYASLLSGPAAVVEPGVSARVYRATEDGDAAVFHYEETASGRAGIGALNDLLAGETVAIVGLGGTGSYVLDLVAKTPVRDIRLFDGDILFQHNAFRAPGAPSLDELRDAPMKVEYLKAIYSKMRRGIVAHPVFLGGDNLHLLEGVTFAFLCMDAGEAKRAVVRKLEALGVPFVDAGMGLDLVDGSLGGIVRTTLSTPERRDHVHQGRISFTGGGEEGLYASNIQVADLNALNAAMAVIRWKKLRGFYRDLEGEHHSTYTTDGNQLVNSDQGT